MKVAVYFSGQPRNIAEGFPYIDRNILQPNSPDVYVHTWFDPSMAGQTIINAGGHPASKPVPADVPELIQRLYHPVDIKIEPQLPFDASGFTYVMKDIKPEFSLSKTYSNRAAHNLIKRPYDIIMSVRFDWAIYEPVVASQYDPTKVILPARGHRERGYDCSFLMGNTTNMQVYSRFHDDLIKYQREGIILCDELYLYRHFEVYNVPVQEIGFRYDLLRN